MQGADSALSGIKSLLFGSRPSNLPLVVQILHCGKNYGPYGLMCNS